MGFYDDCWDLWEASFEQPELRGVLLDCGALEALGFDDDYVNAMYGPGEEDDFYDEQDFDAPGHGATGSGTAGDGALPPLENLDRRQRLRTAPADELARALGAPTASEAAAAVMAAAQPHQVCDLSMGYCVNYGRICTPPCCLINPQTDMYVGKLAHAFGVQPVSVAVATANPVLETVTPVLARSRPNMRHLRNL